MLQFTVNKLKEMDSAKKILLVLIVDLIMLNLAVVVAYMLRLSSLELPSSANFFAYFMAPVLSVTVAYGFRVYEAAARNYSPSIERKLALSQVVAALIWSLALLLVGTTGFARSIVVIYSTMAVLGMILLRRLASMVFNFKSTSSLIGKQVPVLLYGAGREGMALVESLRLDSRFKPIAFLDTDYTLVDRVVSGLRVFPVENISVIMKKFSPRDIIIAKSELNRGNRRVLVKMLLDHGLQVKMAPSLEEIIDGNIHIGDIRPIRVEDLLGRDPVPPDNTLMKKIVCDNVVMITGAGGSIGSELARQVAQFGPRRIVLVENNEYALFEIHRELEAKYHGTTSFTILPCLGDVQSKERMTSILEVNSVDVVFHAAAYKHVRMVQENAIAGIFNNVFGTKVLAEAAIDTGVKRFILISTDKAVRPSSIMGASKRVAEMVIQAFASTKKHNTIFSMVRFGNVLGSTGSVVPLFREQILNGGPVTVTHPDVTRYFMLIPEAAQLVIQAGALAAGGEVFVLDMGEPIKILSLAETMIALSGLKHKQNEEDYNDIDIVFTGLKDGEKLYEELQIGTDISPTSHPRIMRSNEFFMPSKNLFGELNSWTKSTIENGSLTVVPKLMKLAKLGSDRA
jgi:FlaA1/EpsC-like NDP-sugar epimerase